MAGELSEKQVEILPSKDKGMARQIKKDLQENGHKYP